MATDLLKIRDLDPPMGDLFSDLSIGSPLGLWSSPLDLEEGAPEHRILHAQALRLHGTARLDRLGIRPSRGFHNCGSHTDLDWVTAFRLRAWQDGNWQNLIEKTGLERSEPHHPHWFSLGGIETSAVLIEIRRCGIDRWWTPWNLAAGAFTLEGELIAPIGPRLERLLQATKITLDGLPHDVSATRSGGEVRFVTPRYEVGFFLTRPGFSHLGLKTEDSGLGGRNLLFQRAASFPQGPQLHEIGLPPRIDSSVRFDCRGTVEVVGNRISYSFRTGSQHYVLTWVIEPEALRLEVSRESELETRAWISTPWRLAFRNSVSPAHLIGRRDPVGEVGATPLPALLNFPGFGSLAIEAVSPDVFLRYNAIRQSDQNTVELKLGEIRPEDGHYLLPGGRFEAEVVFRPVDPPPVLSDSAPLSVVEACRRTYYTAYSYRPDMGTLSNNGASMPCAICMDTWSALSPGLADLVTGLPAAELVRYSLERWLEEGPSYASGRIVIEGEVHDAEDEYLMTGTAALLGLADYLERDATEGWFRLYENRILAAIDKVRARDLDGDGLIESDWRTGVSGSGQWSTCWFDIISFGWKDAFSNALLYPALVKLSGVLKRRGLDAKAEELTEWSGRLHNAYLPAFYNPETGWLAGWRCKENRLHDHAFLLINGAAIRCGLVPDNRAREILERLLAEMERVGVPDPALGLPGNLWNVPDEDRTDILRGYPFGYYQNGGRTHAHSRHLLMALYRVGLNKQADRLLEQLSVGFAKASVFGGNQSGVDWRYWDDRPCGYEGLLTDQFGFLEAVFFRWGKL
ncbi:MAG: hypothetical protein DRP71_00970 [Verrucomicrobia bacterium]|nr:MAG: hypothetical protein DRP71_00970 [Verrucomicrobiota bacterium]